MTLYTQLPLEELKARAWAAHLRLLENDLREVAAMVEAMITTGDGDTAHRDRIVVTLLMADEIFAALRRCEPPEPKDGDVNFCNRSLVPDKAAAYARALLSVSAEAADQREAMKRRLTEAIEASGVSTDVV